MAGADGKKRRRQNVACDSCKLRRIKCDLLNLLIPSESTSSQPPLHVLVQQNPDVDCTNCKNKGLKCTTDGIVNPTRPNKGGKRIEEARQKFGGGGGVEQLGAGDAEGAGGADGGASAAGGVGEKDVDVDIDFVGTLPRLDQIPFETFITDTQIFPSDLTQNTFADLTHLTSAHTSSDPFASASLGPWLQAQTQAQAQPTGLAPPDLTTPWGSNSSFGDQASSFGPSRSATQSNSPENGSSAGAPASPTAPAPAPAEDAAAGIWRHYTEHPRQAAPSQTPSSSIDKSHNLQTWTRNVGQTFAPWNPSPFRSPATTSTRTVPTTTHPNTSAPTPRDFGSYLMDADVSSPDMNPWSGQQAKPAQHGFASISTSRFGALQGPGQSVPTISVMGDDTHSVAGRKRLRLDSDAASEYSESSGSASDNPWRLFAGPSAVVHWGRREAVQETLADRALGLELSKHLVKVFFQAVHLSFPTVSPESFYIEWERAGQRSDRMTPQQEVLCATIEAWGARFSDSPVVLGLPSNKAGNAPKVITADGRFVPGTQARMHWGRSRLPVCNALVARARRLMDENGILRKPSLTGLQALVLFHQLQHMSNDNTKPAETWMEINLLHSNIIEHMKLLQLMWSSTDEIPLDENELPLPMHQTRMKQRRLFWTMLVGDAFSAAAAGMKPKIDQEDVDAAGEWLAVVEKKLPPSSFKCLALFMLAYHRLACVAREIATKLSNPGWRKGTINIPDMCVTVRKNWAILKSNIDELNAKSAELLDGSVHGTLGFSPLNYLANIRLSTPFLLLVLHQIIREQLDFRKTLRAAYISDDLNPSKPNPEETNLAMLEELRLQSVDVLLQNCRSQTDMMQKLLPTGLVQTSSVFLGVLMAAAQFLAEVPVVEQGYPSDTLGGCGWTWETKQKEIGICINALHQVGWAWHDVNDVLDAIMLSMERMEPSTEQLAAYQLGARSVSQVVLQQRKHQAEVENHAVDVAMTFWPPLDPVVLAKRALEGQSIVGFGNQLVDAPLGPPGNVPPGEESAEGFNGHNALPHRDSHEVTSGTLGPRLPSFNYHSRIPAQRPSTTQAQSQSQPSELADLLQRGNKRSRESSAANTPRPGVAGIDPETSRRDLTAFLLDTPGSMRKSSESGFFNVDISRTASPNADTAIPGATFLSDELIDALSAGHVPDHAQPPATGVGGQQLGTLPQWTSDHPPQPALPSHGPAVPGLGTSAMWNLNLNVDTSVSALNELGPSSMGDLGGGVGAVAAAAQGNANASGIAAGGLMSPGETIREFEKFLSGLGGLGGMGGMGNGDGSGDATMGGEGQGGTAAS